MSSLNKVNPFVFEQLELDSYFLRQALVFAAPAQKIGKYRGDIRLGTNLVDHFFLNVEDGPTIPSQIIDVSQKFDGKSLTLGKNGYVVVVVGKGAGGQHVSIHNNNDLLLNNRYLQNDQIVVLRLLRPGIHTVTDIRNNEPGSDGPTCQITVQYPKPDMPTTKQDLQISESKISPSQLTVWPTQALSFKVVKETRLESKLTVTFDKDKNGRVQPLPMHGRK